MSFARTLYRRASVSLINTYEKVQRSNSFQRVANFAKRVDRRLKKVVESKVAQLTVSLIAGLLAYSGIHEALDKILTSFASVSGVEAGITGVSLVIGVLGFAMAKNHVHNNITVLNNSVAEILQTKKDILDLFNELEIDQLAIKQITTFLGKLKISQVDLIDILVASQTNPELITTLLAIKDKIHANNLNTDLHSGIFVNAKSLSENQTHRFFSLLDTYAQLMADHLNLSPDFKSQLLKDIELLRNELLPPLTIRIDSTQLINTSLPKTNQVADIEMVRVNSQTTTPSSSLSYSYDNGLFTRTQTAEDNAYFGVEIFQADDTLAEEYKRDLSPL